MPGTIDLIGPKGYTHGFVYHGPGSGTRAHTSKLVSRDVGRAKGSLRNASPSLTANRATAALRGKRGSDYQHLAAARLHAAAARSASSPELRSHHLQMAKMHRGIAGRNVGRQTRSEGPMRRPGGSSRGRSAGMAIPHGKAQETKASRQMLAKRGLALPDGSFPVGDADHWQRAFDSVGRAGAKRAALKALLLRTAAQYGKTGKVKGSWLTAANDNQGIELAVDRKHLAISSPFDLIITRGANGEAVVRHRNGGQEIGTITRRGSDGAWVAAAGGKELGPHTRQRGALLELIGTHNRAAGTPYHRPAADKPETETSPLAEALGLKDMDMDAAQLATPSNGADDGPRVTGLSTGGQRIYKRLRGRGFPHARAQAFASRAQRRMGGSK